MLTFQRAHVLKGLCTNLFPSLPFPSLPSCCFPFTAGMVLYAQLLMGSQMTIFNEVEQSTGVNLDCLQTSVPHSSTWDIGSVLGPATCQLFWTRSASSSGLAKQKRLDCHPWSVVIYYRPEAGIHIYFIRSGKLLKWKSPGRGGIFQIFLENDSYSWGVAS